MFRSRSQPVQVSPEQRSRAEPAMAALAAVDPKAYSELESQLSSQGWAGLLELISPSEQVIWLQRMMICTDSDGDIDRFSFCGGVLALTDRHLVFAGASDGGTRNGRWLLNQLASVDLVRYKPLGHILQIGSGAAKTGFSTKYDAACRELLSRIRAGIAKAQEAKPEASGAGSIADELAKLAKLREDGILTNQEFAAQKIRLLGR
jgi:hypothetical protein